MNQYTYLQVKQLFMELFCTKRTGIADPTIRHTKRSTFLVSEEGECEGEQGYWVVEEETGEEGFVSLFSEEDFCVLGAKRSYTRKRVFNRRFKKRKRPWRQTTEKTWLSTKEGPITKARAIWQMIRNSQMTKRFMGRKAVRKVARKEARRTRTRSNPPRKASPPRATLHHLLVRRT